MAKKKKTKESIVKKCKTSMKDTDAIWEAHPELHGTIHKQNWDFITMVNHTTQSYFDKIWVDNLKDNIKKKLLKKHKFLVQDCVGLGKNKAVVGVGAGPSFNKNRADLQHFLNMDGVREWQHRHYITICANHQFKPLLSMGIIPDFVLLVDASDVVYDQLCKDIPEHGKSTILITGLHCSPKVLKEWSDQGREIRFLLNTANETKEAFQKLTGDDPNPYAIEMGGNVLNGSWVISITKFHSNVFICVGNDLSFSLYDKLDEQRTNYYADKDYSTNAKVSGTGRDEAARYKRWGGISRITRKDLIWAPTKRPQYDIEIDLVGTSHTLWVYKTWLEATIMRQMIHPVSFHYFNCSEGGILGVMSKNGNGDHSEMRLTDNWYLLDEKCRFYHTARLRDTFEHFEHCREVFDKQCLKSKIGVLGADGLVPGGLGAIAPPVDQNGFTGKSKTGLIIPNMLGHRS